MQRHKDAQIKRRKKGESSTRKDSEQSQALKALLVEKVTVTTKSEYKNTREMSRLTKLVNEQRQFSVGDSITLIFKGRIVLS
jgi:hypothetical protein